MGKQVRFSQEIADAIVSRIEGGESVAKICRDKNMPNATTVCRWQDANTEFGNRCAKAREIAVDRMAEETIEIADSSTDADSAACARVRVSARQWYASKIAPRKYGDRITHDGTVNHKVELADRLTAALARVDDRKS